MINQTKNDMKKLRKRFKLFLKKKKEKILEESVEEKVRK